MKLLTGLEKHPGKPFWVLIGLCFVGFLGVIDYLTGYEISFSLFYLFPIILVAWQTGRPLGILISILSAIVWLTADVLAGNSYSHPIIFLWNTFIRFGFFVTIVYFLTALRRALEHERELSRVDSMTGIFNYRSFSDLLQMEIDRARRYSSPFTVAYIDLDNFKAINDQYGHSIGDLVLQHVAQYIQKNLRKTDIIARLGGDEFAILFPETNQESAAILLTRIQQGLLQEMGRSNWPVTFSIGVIAYSKVPFNVDEVIKRADDVMYSVKKHGKNAIQYKIYAG